MSAPQRRRTNQSIDSSKSLRKRVTEDFAVEEEAPKAVQVSFPSYDDFPWVKIEEYLSKKWPHWTGFNASRVSL